MNIDFFFVSEEKCKFLVIVLCWPWKSASAAFLFTLHCTTEAVVHCDQMNHILFSIKTSIKKKDKWIQKEYIFTSLVLYFNRLDLIIVFF